MTTVVIYATIMLNNIVSVIEYKGEVFKNNEECIIYLQKYNSHINKTLKEHLDKKETGATVLYIGCSERSKFIQEGMGA
jgi:ABC-type Fe3+-hydroxamate transport system substrate-binding protein